MESSKASFLNFLVLLTDVYYWKEDWALGYAYFQF